MLEVLLLVAAHGIEVGVVSELVGGSSIELFATPSMELGDPEIGLALELFAPIGPVAPGVQIEIATGESMTWTAEPGLLWQSDFGLELEVSAPLRHEDGELSFGAMLRASYTFEIED